MSIRRIAATTVALGLLVTVWSESGVAADVPRGPTGRSFQPPEALPKEHGRAIWKAPYRGLLAISGARNTKFLYTQVGVNGGRVASSAYVAVPKGEAPAGGWPIVAWGHGTTGLADACAPTRYDNAEDAAKHGPLLARRVQAGYAVVRTDYEGLGTPGGHPYLIGESEGRAVLDSALAARRVVPSLGRRVVIAGHSQGGHAALWDTALAPDYAPRLRVRGVIALAPPHSSEIF